LAGHATVWIGGSAIFKHTFVAARGRPGGVNLGLQRIGGPYQLIWNSYVA
jgi:hypothetical protein